MNPRWEWDGDVIIVREVPSGTCFGYDTMSFIIQCDHVFNGIRDLPAGNHLGWGGSARSMSESSKSTKGFANSFSRNKICAKIDHRCQLHWRASSDDQSITNDWVGSWRAKCWRNISISEHAAYKATSSKLGPIRKANKQASKVPRKPDPPVIHAELSFQRGSAKADRF